MTKTSRVAIACTLGLLSAACGGSTSQAGGETGADVDAAAGPVGPVGPCDMAGTYTQRFALEPGGMACPTLFDQTLTITPKAVTNGAHDAGPPGTGSDCSWTVDASSCMLTTSCTLSANGFTTRASGTIAFVGAEGSGKESVRISDAGGDVLSSCAYDITMTRVQGPQ